MKLKPLVHLENPAETDFVKEYHDCRVPKSEESLFNSLAFLNSNQFFQIDLGFYSLYVSEKQMLKRLHDFHKKNVFPPRLNLSIKEQNFNILRKLSTSYPNTCFNNFMPLFLKNGDDLLNIKINLDTLEAFAMHECVFSNNDKFE